MKNLLTIFKLICIVTLVFSLSDISQASSYKEMKSLAQEGKSDTFESYVGLLDDEPIPEYKIDSTDYYSKLFQIYRELESRETINKIREILNIEEDDSERKGKEPSDDEVLACLNQKVPDREILALILMRSKMISSAENSLRAALNLYPQTALMQNLFETYRSFSKRISIGIGDENQRSMIQMNYPSPGMLALRGSIVETDIEIAWNEYLKVERDVFIDADILLVKIRNVDEMLQLNKRSESLLSNLKDVAEAQYKAGTRSFADLVRFKTELEKRKDTVERMEAIRRGLISNLLSMMNLPQRDISLNIDWKMNPPIKVDYKSSYDSLLEHRQEIRIVELQLKKMDLMIQMGIKDASPDLTFGFSYLANEKTFSIDSKDAMSSDDEKAGSMSMNDPSMGPDSSSMDQMSFMNRPMIDYRDSDVPLSLAWITELHDRRKAMAEMLEAEKDMSFGMLDMLIRDYHQLIVSEKRYSNKVIPDAEAALTVVRSGYSSGQNDFNDLINAEETLLMAQMELADISLEKRIKFAELQRLVGFPISETNKKGFEIKE